MSEWVSEWNNIIRLQKTNKQTLIEYTKINIFFNFKCQNCFGPHLFSGWFCVPILLRLYLTTITTTTTTWLRFNRRQSTRKQETQERFACRSETWSSHPAGRLRVSNLKSTHACSKRPRGCRHHRWCYTLSDWNGLAVTEFTAKLQTAQLRPLQVS